MLGKIKVGKGNWWSYTCNGKVKTLRRHMKAVTFIYYVSCTRCSSILKSHESVEISHNIIKNSQLRDGK